MTLTHRLILLLTGLVLAVACAGPSGVGAPDFLDRQPVDTFQFRLLSWNVKHGSIFPPGGSRHAGFARIVRAVNPDLLVLQEIEPRYIEFLGEMMDRLVPLGDSRSWRIHGTADNVIISRYPLRQTYGELAVPYPMPNAPDFQYGQAMALVDLPDNEVSSDAYIVAMHNRSRAADDDVRRRQIQSDVVARWLRRLQEEAIIPRGTPLIVAGDMNVLPGMPARHLETLMDGDIADEESFGKDFHPDWDGTGLRDASPSHNGEGKALYTWRDDTQPFPPGQLSRILYSDSVMTLRHAFVLNTVTMSAGQLARYGLERTDVLLDGRPGVFDHMPLVADFAVP